MFDVRFIFHRINQIMSIQLVSNQKKKSKTPSSFLKKTFEMLCDPINQTSIRWAKSDIGFVVVDEDRFSKEVLPLYFKHSNYSSFVRQLNMYNFHKIREGNSESYFHHELFDKNRKDLLGDIKRKPEKKKEKRRNGIDSDDQEISLVRVRDKEKSQIVHQPMEKEDKKIFQNTRHVFSSEQENRHPSPQKNSQRVSIRNILIAGENDDDKLSINNELAERIPRYPTKQIFYPSNHNLYPFSYPVKMSQFNIFF